MTSIPAPQVHNIAAGVPFALNLASGILKQHGEAPETLADILVLLPTRRACRILREAFLRISDGKALILPRIQPLGDVDDERLTLFLSGQDSPSSALSIPPAISAVQRRFMLARLITALPAFQQGWEHALKLADTLSVLIDHTHTQGLDLRLLKDLVPGEFAQHWKITLDFLDLIALHWPLILQEKNLIDKADRRNRLILSLNDFWQHAPPLTPVIAAGSTGSIPAVAGLLATISRLPQGCVVLPGLDRNIDDESWNTLGEEHPQYGLKHLLNTIPLERDLVTEWCGVQGNRKGQARRQLATEIMRPAATSSEWVNLAQHSAAEIENIRNSLENLSLIECRHEREEAEAISVIIREVLETPGKTVSLVTPDRMLARRVAVSCRRWGIVVDDSGGQPLALTAACSFLLQILRTVMSGMEPVQFLSLVKHPLFTARYPQKELESLVALLEIRALRGLPYGKGMEGLRRKMEKTGKEFPAALYDFLGATETILAPLTRDIDAACDLASWIERLVSIAENLCGEPETPGPEKLWRGESGELLAEILLELSSNSGIIPEISLDAFASILDHGLKSEVIRPHYRTHPRISILGQIEARLIDSDVVIMGGLNEGTWPAEPENDPWMSRPMRKQFGLPGYERGTGLSAHDFVQGLCAQDVFITRSTKQNGTPTVAARWIQRLNTIMQALSLDVKDITATRQLIWADMLDKPVGFHPVERPAPRPPVDIRPTRLPVTAIETWLKDPYSIYAKYILGLRKIDPLQQDFNAAIQGTLIHSIMDRFVGIYDTVPSPESMHDSLMRIAYEEMEKIDPGQSVSEYWWMRFSALAGWIVTHEHEWRMTARNLSKEEAGELALTNGGKTFTLTARADRIDMKDGALAIIDYKTAGSFTRKSIETCDAPQLPLEGLIAREGGFQSIPPHSTGYLGYWILSGGAQPGRIVAVQDRAEDSINAAQQNLVNLIAAYNNPDMPYYSIPRPSRAPRYNDYVHLARIREWSAADRDNDDGDTE